MSVSNTSPTSPTTSPAPLKPKRNSISSDNFIIKFLDACDIPPPDSYRSSPNPYLKAYFCFHDGTEYKRIGNEVKLLKRLETNRVVWNTFRNFNCNPPRDSFLMIEMYHKGSDSDVLLGYYRAPLISIISGQVLSCFMIHQKGTREKYPNFSVRIQKTFINTLPPDVKTFFIIRHGESKWNEAQSKINIAGMLDRDHGLTEQGIEQAKQLNSRWKKACLKVLSTDNTPSSSSNSTPHTSTLPSRDNSGLGSLLEGYDEFSSATTSTSSSTLPNSDNSNPSSSTKSSSPLNDLTSLSLDLPNIQEIDDDFFCNLFDQADESSSDNSSEDEDDDVLRLSQCNNGVENLLDFSSTSPNSSVEFKNSSIPIKSGVEMDILINDFHAESNLPSPASSSDLVTMEEPPQVSATTSTAAFITNNLLPLLSNPSTSTSSSTTVSSVEPKAEEAESEAVLKRRAQYVEMFMHSDRVFSSPFTRAIQTALVSLQDHPSLTHQGIILYQMIREIKRIGGLDSVGIEVGEGILKRVYSEFLPFFGHDQATKFTSLIYDLNDTYSSWWTPMSSYENHREQQERVREFLTFSRYTDAKIPIFVGHSLFFKAFYSHRISKRLDKNKKSFSEKLRKFRLSNASLLAVTVIYKEQRDGTADAIIVDADLIFGGGFHGHEAPKEARKPRGERVNRSIRENRDSFIEERERESLSSSSSTSNSRATKPLEKKPSSNSGSVFSLSYLQKDLKTTTSNISKSVKMFSKNVYDIFQSDSNNNNNNH